MDTIASVTSTPPRWDQYCNDDSVAVTFENRILYAMCRDFPAHCNPHVTAGKISAIGRIYAASPERGAGKGKGPLAKAIARQLQASSLDSKIAEIAFADRLSDALLAKVVSAHEFLVQEISDATKGWSENGKNTSWEPRRHHSFASKYLHFHRPNAFPIMDKYAKAGLLDFGMKGAHRDYQSFCSAFLEYAGKQNSDWTPRSLDPDLVVRGQNYLESRPKRKNKPRLKTQLSAA